MFPAKSFQMLYGMRKGISKEGAQEKALSADFSKPALRRLSEQNGSKTTFTPKRKGTDKRGAEEPHASSDGNHKLCECSRISQAFFPVKTLIIHDSQPKFVVSKLI